MVFFLRDIFDEKLKRDEADADQFRSVVQYEFAAGLNATVEGAASAMRRWVKIRPAWVSEVQHARRLAALTAIEAAISGRAAEPWADPETATAPERSLTFSDRGGRTGKARLPSGRKEVRSEAPFAAHQSE